MLEASGTMALPLAAMVILSGLLHVQAQTNFQRLKSFGSSLTDGAQPVGQLLEGKDGILYGVTYSGGSTNRGTVFKLNKDGSGYAELVLLTNVSAPLAGVIQGTDGFLYGSTSVGGSSNVGTIFKVNTNGSAFQVVFNFDTTTTNGWGPSGSLALWTNGMLYGTTSQGGSSNVGTIFKINTNGSSFALLHGFSGANDGANPDAGVWVANDGFLYGTTQNGGSNNFGTVFKVDANGGNYSILHHFGGTARNDGRLPAGRIVLGSDGLLYGATYNGGTEDIGTLFRISTNGNAYAVVHHFIREDIGGYQPWTGLVEGSNGVFYGTTRYGNTNSNDAGTVFKINGDGGGYGLLHQLTGTGGDGTQPRGALLIGSDNALYGTTFYGGDAGIGIAFKLNFLSPRVTITRISQSGSGKLLDLAGGASGQLYNIQATTNIGVTNGWQVIGSSAGGIDGTFQFLDTNASNYPTRFYRSALP